MIKRCCPVSKKRVCFIFRNTVEKIQFTSIFVIYMSLAVLSPAPFHEYVSVSHKFKKILFYHSDVRHKKKNFKGTSWLAEQMNTSSYGAIQGRQLCWHWLVVHHALDCARLVLVYDVIAVSIGEW